MEDTTSSHTRTLTELEHTAQLLMACSNDAKNTLHRNNVWVVDLPEEAEGDQSAIFAETNFKQMLHFQQVSPMYQVERAQDSLLVQFLDFRDRDLMEKIQRKYSMLYPSKLRVLHNGAAQYFDTPTQLQIGQTPCLKMSVQVLDQKYDCLLFANDASNSFLDAPLHH